MTTSRAAALLRKPGQPKRATFLDLFFDLVFVFALTRVSQRLLTDVTSQRWVVLTEVGHTVLLLLALLIVWFVTAWVTDLYDPTRPEIQLVVIGTMFGALVMAVAVPDAFGARALGFAGAYVAIHIGRHLVLVPALRGHKAQRRSASVLLWFAVSAVPWIVGATLPGSPTRGVLWTLAIAIDLAGAMLLWHTPWVGRMTSEWPVVAEYLSERYRQFFIIALGELILVTGITYSGKYVAGGHAAAFGVAFVTTALLWRIYMYRAGELLPDAIAAAPQPGRLVRRAMLAHLLMVAGIVAAAVGYELVIEHPSGHTDSAWIGVILGGPVLFLAGRAFFEYAVFARVSRSRLIGALVLAGISPAMILLPPLAVAITAAVVLAGIVTSDGLRAKGRPPELASPPR
ncbi:low temperature requirement protein A [Micromonospora sp. HUAS YX12]|uniref:Low temperature requirement protein A n=1 Tax=Micromonospora sp. HUAS YX12 TaxID=3156396 RepID=A0AAU7QU07_9ACTN